MLLELLTERGTTSVDLADGTARVGGSPTDTMCLPGLPHGLLVLEVEGDRLTVTSTRSMRIGATLFPARVPRLLAPGEAITLPNDAVLRRAVRDPRSTANDASPARREVETAFVARALLRGAMAPECTRAAVLTCLAGPDRGTTFPVAFSDCILGRARDADIRLRDRATSRRHARLRRSGEHHVLTELSTTNGLYVNGSRLRGARTLAHGDVLELGVTVLRFDGGARAPAELTLATPPPRPSGDAGRHPACETPHVSADAPAPRLTQRDQARVARGEAAPRAREGDDARPEEAPLHESAPMARALRPLEVLLLALGALLALAGLTVTALMLRS